MSKCGQETLDGHVKVIIRAGGNLQLDRFHFAHTDAPGSQLRAWEAAAHEPSRASTASDARAAGSNAAADRAKNVFPSSSGGESLSAPPEHVESSWPRYANIGAAVCLAAGGIRNR
jgi:hypothetical protein